MKKIVIFLLLIGFCFGQFWAMQVPATPPTPQSTTINQKIYKSSQAIGRFMWNNKKAVASTVALTGVGLFMGVGVWPMIAVGAGYAGGAKMEAAWNRLWSKEPSNWPSKVGIYGAGMAAADYLVSDFIYRYLFLDDIQRMTYNATGTFGFLWGTGSGEYPIMPLMPHFYASAIGALVGATAVCVSSILWDQLPYKKRAQYQKDADAVVKSISSDLTQQFTPVSAWEKITGKGQGFRGNDIDIADSVIINCLNRVPMLACATLAAELEEKGAKTPQTAGAWINLPIQILDFVNVKIEKAQKKNDDSLIRSWLATKNAMLYQLVSPYKQDLNERYIPINPDAPTVMQQIFLNSESKSDLVEKMFKHFAPQAIFELLLLNQDSHCRTILHRIAGKNNDILTIVLNNFLTEQTTPETLKALSIKEASEDQGKNLSTLLKIYFKLSTQSYDRTAKNEDGTETTTRIKKVASLIVDDQGQNPLHKAAFNLNNKFIELFFNDPELLQMAMLQQDNEGRNPLHLAVLAASQAKKPIELDFVATSASEIIDQNTITTLITLLTNKLSKDTILRLLATKDNKGMTPFHYAAQAKNDSVIKQLITILNKAEAESRGLFRKIFGREPRLLDALTIRDAKGNTALQYAIDPFTRYFHKYTMNYINNQLGENKDKTIEQLTQALNDAIQTVQEAIKVRDVAIEKEAGDANKAANKAANQALSLREAVKLAKIRKMLIAHGIEGYFKPTTGKASVEAKRDSLVVFMDVGQDVETPGMPSKSSASTKLQKEIITPAQIVEMLSPRNKEGNNFLHYAVMAVSHNKNAVLPIDLDILPIDIFNAAIKQQNKSGDTPLHLAIRSNNLGLVNQVKRGLTNQEIKQIIQSTKKGLLRRSVGAADFGLSESSEVRNWVKKILTVPSTTNVDNGNAVPTIDYSKVAVMQVKPKEGAGLGELQKTTLTYMPTESDLAEAEGVWGGGVAISPEAAGGANKPDVAEPKKKRSAQEEAKAKDNLEASLQKHPTEYLSLIKNMNKFPDTRFYYGMQFTLGLGGKKKRVQNITVRKGQDKATYLKTDLIKKLNDMVAKQ